MELSSEDSLRLNVLLANAVAIRIDEGGMLVYGLSRNNEEVKIQLNPNCRGDQYIRRVRELLSSSVLGSPGGYPVFLKRWTRMGQTRDIRLADLLMLGEPEAVVAVSGAAGLTDDLARRAWWAMPDSENARRMLKRECVANGEIGKVLADFLIEFLPFEQEPAAIIESVRLILQPGLTDEPTRMNIWNRGRQKSVFRIGFLQALPDNLPEQLPPRADLEQHQPVLESMTAAGNPVAEQLLRVLSGAGQSYLHTCELAIRKPSDQDAVVALLDTIGEYFAPTRVSPMHYQSVATIVQESRGMFSSDPMRNTELLKAVEEVQARLPELARETNALVVLSHVAEPVVRPIFSRTDAIGSVMRRKLEPVTNPILEQFARLRGI
jgi:hypothetical protein